MVPRRVIAFAVSLLLSGAAFAQSVEPVEQPAANPTIFGSVSGGELALLGKTSQHWSGSFGVMTSASRYPFAGSGISSSNRGYDATFGGTLVKDRAWFFASAQRSSGLFGSQFDATLPQTSPSSSQLFDVKATAQIGSRQTIASTFASQQSATTPIGTPLRNTGSFLSLNYTGVVSDNMFFTAKVTRSGSETTTP